MLVMRHTHTHTIIALPTKFTQAFRWTNLKKNMSWLFNGLRMPGLSGSASGTLKYYFGYFGKSFLVGLDTVYFAENRK